MKTNIARVCQIGTTNYVDYKGERLTVEEHEAKYGVKVHIPKNVKVCELMSKNDKKIGASIKKLSELQDEYEHGSRAKKADTAHMDAKRKSHGKQEVIEAKKVLVQSFDGRPYHDLFPDVNLDEIDPPNLRRVELFEDYGCEPTAILKTRGDYLRQGFRWGFLVAGAFYMVLGAVLISLIIHSLHH